MKRQLILPILFITAAGCAAEPAAEQRIASLRGTEPDCHAVVAAPVGDLVPTRALRACFDHFLTGRGEVDDAAIRAALDQALTAQLPAEAHRQAMLQYERYLAYLDAARALAESPAAASVDPIEAQARLAREHLGPEVAEAFFAEEWAARARLMRHEVEEGPAQAFLRTRQAVALGRSLARPEAEIRGLREAVYGPEAAARLAAVDAARAAFEARYTAYRVARAARPEAEAEAVRAAYFEGPELIRVRALDRLR